MLKRKFYNILSEWKKTKNQSCLLVKGARQLEKHTLLMFLEKKTIKAINISTLLKHRMQRTFLMVS